MNKLKLHRGGCRTRERLDRVVSLACKFCEDGGVLDALSSFLRSVNLFFFRILLDLHFFLLVNLNLPTNLTIFVEPRVSSSSNCDRHRPYLSRPGITLLDNARSRFATAILEASRHDTYYQSSAISRRLYFLSRPAIIIYCRSDKIFSRRFILKKINSLLLNVNKIYYFREKKISYTYSKYEGTIVIIIIIINNRTNGGPELSFWEFVC